MISQNDKLSAILMSAYIQYLLVESNTVKSGTFVPSSTATDLRRKVLYQIKAGTQKKLSSANVASEVTGINTRGACITASFIRDFIFTEGDHGYRRNNAISTFQRLMANFAREKLSQLEFTDVDPKEHITINMNDNLDSIAFLLNDNMYQSDPAKIFTSSENLDIFPLKSKGLFLYEAITKIPEVITEVATYRRVLKGLLTPTGLAADYRPTLKDFMSVCDDIGTYLSYFFSSNSARARIVRQSAMMITELRNIDGVPSGVLVYEDNTFPSQYALFEFLAMDRSSSDLAFLESINTWLNSLCQKFSGLGIEVNTIPPTERAVDDVVREEEITEEIPDPAADIIEPVVTNMNQV